MLCAINGHYILKGTTYVMLWSLYTEGDPICYVPLMVTIYGRVPHMLYTINGHYILKGTRYVMCH